MTGILLSACTKLNKLPHFKEHCNPDDFSVKGKIRLYQYDQEKLTPDDTSNIASALMRICNEKDRKIVVKSFHAGSIAKTMRDHTYIIRLGNVYGFVNEEYVQKLKNEVDVKQTIKDLQSELEQNAIRFETQKVLLNLANAENDRLRRIAENIVPLRSVFLITSFVTKILGYATEEALRILLVRISKLLAKMATKLISKNAGKAVIQSFAVPKNIPILSIGFGLGLGAYRISTAEKNSDYVKAAGEVVSGVLKSTPAYAVGYGIDVAMCASDIYDVYDQARIVPFEFDEACEALGLNSSEAQNKQKVDAAFKDCSKVVHPDQLKNVNLSKDEKDLCIQAQQIIGIAKAIIYQHNGWS